MIKNKYNFLFLSLLVLLVVSLTTVSASDNTTGDSLIVGEDNGNSYGTVSTDIHKDNNVQKNNVEDKKVIKDKTSSRSNVENVSHKTVYANNDDSSDNDCVEVKNNTHNINSLKSDKNISLVKSSNVSKSLKSANYYVNNNKKLSTTTKVTVISNNILNTTFKVSVKSGTRNVQSGEVKLTYNGNNVKTVQVSNGIAIITVIPEEVGNQFFDFEYIGDSTYDSSDTYRNVYIYRVNTKIKVTTMSNNNANTSFKVTVTTRNGDLVKSGNVELIYTTNYNYYTKKVYNGISTITLSPELGKNQEFIFQFIGDSTYYSSNKLTKIVSIYKAKAKTLYVRSYGSDDYGTGSYSNPYATLNKAVNMAIKGSVINLDGTFTDLGTSSTIVINKNVNITGGTFKNIDETHKLISIKKGVTVTFNKVTFYNTTSHGILDNEGTLNLIKCTFNRNGIYYPTSEVKTTTRAMIRNEGTLNIKSSTFVRNSGINRGIIYNMQNSKLTITSCSFENSKAVRHSGVINNVGTLTIKKSAFNSNHARFSGGAIVNTGKATIESTTFDSNYVEGNYDSEHTYGGAIFNRGTLTVSGSRFVENSASWYGGAIYNSGTVTVKSTDFNDNGGYGSCIYVDTVSASRYESYYLGRDITSYYSSKVTVSNCKIRNSYSAFYNAYATSTDSRVKIEGNYFDRCWRLTLMFHGLSLPKKYYYL